MTPQFEAIAVQEQDILHPPDSVIAAHVLDNMHSLMNGSPSQLTPENNFLAQANGAIIPEKFGLDALNPNESPIPPDHDCDKCVIDATACTLLQAANENSSFMDRLNVVAQLRKSVPGFDSMPNEQVDTLIKQGIDVVKTKRAEMQTAPAIDSISAKTKTDTGITVEKPAEPIQIKVTIPEQVIQKPIKKEVAVPKQTVEPKVIQKQSEVEVTNRQPPKEQIIEQIKSSNTETRTVVTDILKSEPVVLPVKETITQSSSAVENKYSASLQQDSPEPRVVSRRSHFKIDSTTGERIQRPDAAKLVIVSKEVRTPVSEPAAKTIVEPIPPPIADRAPVLQPVEQIHVRSDIQDIPQEQLREMKQNSALPAIEIVDIPAHINPDNDPAPSQIMENADTATASVQEVETTNIDIQEMGNTFYFQELAQTSSEKFESVKKEVTDNILPIEAEHAAEPIKLQEIPTIETNPDTRNIFTYQEPGDDVNKEQDQPPLEQVVIREMTELADDSKDTVVEINNLEMQTEAEQTQTPVEQVSTDQVLEINVEDATIAIQREKIIDQNIPVKKTVAVETEQPAPILENDEPVSVDYLFTDSEVFETTGELPDIQPELVTDPVDNIPENIDLIMEPQSISEIIETELQPLTDIQEGIIPTIDSNPILEMAYQNETPEITFDINTLIQQVEGTDENNTEELNEATTLETYTTDTVSESLDKIQEIIEILPDIGSEESQIKWNNLIESDSVLGDISEMLSTILLQLQIINNPEMPKIIYDGKTVANGSVLYQYLSQEAAQEETKKVKKNRANPQPITYSQIITMLWSYANILNIYIIPEVKAA